MLPNTNLRQSRLFSDQLQRAVIVAVITMRMMEMSIDKIVDVIAVRNGLVTAVGPVNVSRFMAAAAMVRCTLGRVGRRDGQLVLFDAAVDIDVVQMTVVQVIDVAVVLDGRVAAVGTVLVVVVFVDVSHRIDPQSVKGVKQNTDREWTKKCRQIVQPLSAVGTMIRGSFIV